MTIRITSLTTFGKAALAYAARYCWRLFPLRPRSKEPLIDRWPERATADLRQLAEWWSRWPQANIALCCGQGSGVVVVDVDPRSGGDETWAELADINGAVHTLEALSGSGGSHYFFQTPDSALVKGKLGDGVDLQGERSYLVLAPSIHPCGDPYEWVSEGIAPATIPEWLLEKWPKTQVAIAGQHQGAFKPHTGLQLPEEVRTQLATFLVSSGLTLQRDGRYRGQCVIPHGGTGECDCPSSLYVSSITGRWTCFCADHPGASPGRCVSGGPAALLTLAGIDYHPSASGHRPRRLTNWEVRV